MPRIGPLFHSLKPQTDPDPARTEKVVAALRALGQGGKALADSPLLTAGARADFGDWARARTWPDLRSLRSSPNRMSPRARSSGTREQVSRILHYRLVTDKADRGTPDPHHRGRADHRLRHRRGLNDLGRQSFPNSVGGGVCSVAEVRPVTADEQLVGESSPFGGDFGWPNRTQSRSGRQEQPHEAMTRFRSRVSLGAAPMIRSVRASCSKRVHFPSCLHGFLI